MKFVIPLLLGSLWLNITLMGQIVDPDSAQSSNGLISVKGYRNTFYISGNKALDYNYFRIRDGVFQISNDSANWGPGDSGLLTNNVSGNWDGYKFLGATGFGNDPVRLHETLKGLHFDTLALGKDTVIEIGSKYNEKGTGPEVFLYKENIEQTTNVLLSSFKVNSWPFAFRLEGGFFIKNNILAIVADTDQADVSFIIFYDMKRLKPIGYRTFSSIRYLPNEEMVEFGKPLPNVISRTMDPANIPVTKVPLFDGKSLSPELRDTSLFKVK